jgi:hypothetical protein
MDDEQERPDELVREERAVEPAHEAQARLVPPTGMGGPQILYANFVQVSTSPHDFTLHFSWFTSPLMSEPPPPGSVIEITPRPLASISIPLTLVQGIITVLQSQVDAWEAAFQRPFPTERRPNQ